MLLLLEQATAVAARMAATPIASAAHHVSFLRRGTAATDSAAPTTARPIEQHGERLQDLTAPALRISESRSSSALKLPMLSLMVPTSDAKSDEIPGQPVE